MISPGAQIESLIQRTEHKLLFVAPFIKLDVLSRLLDYVDDKVSVDVVTRWRVDEIALGVSDLDVYLLFQEHSNRTLWLRSDLHAKYYRGDERSIVGSANLTKAALGWSITPNLELLIESPVLDDFEQQLFLGSVVATNPIYSHIKELVATLPLTTEVSEAGIFDEMTSTTKEDTTTVPPESWLPLLRHPGDLYSAYSGEVGNLTKGSQIAAFSDLCVLHIPGGLGQEYFQRYVGAQLLHMPLIQQVDAFVETPQRFGSVRDYLNRLPCSGRKGFDSSIAWQTLMRWLLHFLPNRYRSTVIRHSEIFQRVP